MTHDHNGEDLSTLLSHLEFQTAKPLDFREGSPGLVQFLAEVAAHLNALAVADFGGRLGKVRQEGLVEQVVGAAFQTFGETDPHPDVFEKAAMLLRGITAGHPFQDGNKRTGFLLAAFYLDQVGHPVPHELAIDEAERLCLQVSTGQLRDVARIARQLRHLYAAEHWALDRDADCLQRVAKSSFF